jgi:hypothetical protein
MTPKFKARLYVLLIFFACAAPVALSFLTYYVWKPEKLMNYGELLQSSPSSSASSVATPAAIPNPGNPYQGKWVMLLIDEPSCPASCEKRLYAMRQIVRAMEVKKDKLAQLWVIFPAGAPKAELLAQYQNTDLLVHDLAWLPKLPEPNIGRIFLIDPNGVLVLRYPADPDIKRMMKDVGRLLDVKRM